MIRSGMFNTLKRTVFRLTMWNRYSAILRVRVQVVRADCRRFGATAAGDYIIVVYEKVDEDTIRVVTAYEVGESGRTQMAKRTFKRMSRTTPLGMQEAERDRELRRRIVQEFPPLEPEERQDGAISEALRSAIKGSSKSVYQICKDSGISQIVVSRFLSGERDIRLATADRLAKALGLSLASK